MKRFGFGNQTGIELEGEEAGSLPTMEKPYEVANAAMGKGATATALQDAANAVNKAKQYVTPDANAYGMVSSHNDLFRQKNRELMKSLYTT